MSPGPSEANRKRKRRDNDCGGCCVKQSRREHESTASNLQCDCQSTAVQTHLLDENKLLGDMFILPSATPPPGPIDCAEDHASDGLCEGDPMPDLNFLANTELAGSETDTPNSVDSGICNLNDQDFHQAPQTIGFGHPGICTTKIRESQQAFTIYSSASISQRKYKGPSNLQAFAQWFHVDSHILDKDLSEHFRHGSRHSEEMDVPPSLSMPALCPEWADYVDAYFQEVAPLFPVIRRENTIRAATYLSRFTILKQNPVSDRPAMACVYACIALGARSKGQPGVAQAYIEAACSLTGYLTSMPYLESAQALLLIAIEHRGREKNGAAFLAVRQAISILNSMGLHRTPSYGNDHLSVAHQQTDRRIWWTAYALEKTIALEDGRPSSTHDCSLDKDVPADVAAMHHLNAWKSFVNLAKIQSQISEGFYDQNAWRDTLNFNTMLEMQKHLDQALTEWSDTLSEPLNPCRRSKSCPSDFLSVRTFLCFQFHHALIILHRSALTEDTTLDRAISDISGEDSRHALSIRRSECICANSARVILKSYLCFLKRSNSSPLVTLNQPLLAVYVLTIYTLKHPSASVEHHDLELLQSATYAIEKGYQQIGLPTGFSSILTTLRDAAMHDSEACSVPMHDCLGRTSGGARSRSAEEFVDTSESATKVTHPDLIPEERSLANPLSNITSLWPNNSISLGAIDNILVGTWLEAPHLTSVPDLAGTVS